MSLNHVRPWRNIYRRKSRQFMWAMFQLAEIPIAVQTMTNTLTTDVAATIAQVQAAAEAGADIVRVSWWDSSKALKVKESLFPSAVFISITNADRTAEAGRLFAHQLGNMDQKNACAGDQTRGTTIVPCALA